ncbi:MAG: ABC transporter substrate-binding protein [Magnetococcales bacterium]|nr:ABC transporter substrate-binding protein [Magnetococcales bacterium]MBF0437968.1 ABC transporter substrate-binding protein [Magnetococcales bacterium]
MFRRFMINRLFFLAIVLAPLSVWSVTIVQGNHMDKLATSVHQAIAILNDKELAVPARREERREMLRRVIYQEFDFSRMSQSAMGRVWNKFTPGQQQRFSELFKRLLENTYMNMIERYDGERVEFLKEMPKAEDLVLVDSLIHSKGQKYRISYFLHHNGGGEWKVDDVIIEGVSVVSNYRSQFQQAVRTEDDIEPLLLKLEEKVRLSPQGG